jgi:Na+/proline symporter
MALRRRTAADDTAAAARAVYGMWVAILALVAVVGIVGIVVLSLPSGQKAQNIMAIASSSFGVVGAIVGAYFGVSAASRAAEIVHASATEGELPDTRRPPSKPGGEPAP